MSIHQKWLLIMAIAAVLGGAISSGRDGVAAALKGALFYFGIMAFVYILQLH